MHSELRDWVAAGLEKKGKTQRGLAKHLGIDPMGVSRMLNGKRKIQVDEIPKISSYLGEQCPVIQSEVTGDAASVLGDIKKVVGLWLAGIEVAEIAMSKIAKKVIK